MATGKVLFDKGCAHWFLRDGRLRSGWRVLLYVATIIFVNLAISFAIGLALALWIGASQSNAGVPADEIARRINAAFANPIDNPAPTFALLAIRVMITLATVWLFRRFIDRRSLGSLGLQLEYGWLKDCLLGFAFSTLAWACIFFLSLGVGAATIAGFVWEAKDVAGLLGTLAFGVLMNLMVGVSEEVDARGYVLQNLAEGIRLAPAILISSLYFGLLHLLNPGAGVGSTLGIFFAGVVLALGYYATGKLWFPIGMHAGWNWAEGPLFGFLVSGLNMGGLVRLKISGPDWLMGGEFGPEAGLLSMIVELAMIGLLFIWGRKRHASMKPEVTLV